MLDPEKTLDYLESQIPVISGAAFDVAYMQALASGQRVLVSADDGIYEVASDGTRTRILNISPPQPVALGTRMRIP
jgi:hypothetical protein